MNVGMNLTFYLLSKMLWQFTLLHFLQLFVPAVFALSSPPSGAITVGNGGKYSTISAALQDTSSSVRDLPDLRDVFLCTLHVWMYLRYC